MSLQEEPRSFAPRGRRVKVDPIPTQGATNEDLARGQNQLHLCYEDEKRKNAKRHTAVRGEIKALGSELTELRNALIGAPNRKKPPKVAAMSGWQLGWRLAIGVGGGFGALQVLLHIAAVLDPDLVPAIDRLLHLAASGLL